MNEAEKLYQLQEIDLGLIRTTRRLEEIETLLNQDEAVQAAQNQAQTAHNHLTPLQTQARNLDLEMQSTIEKARTTEENLYSGTVKNTKEMRDMQQEIESLKKRHGELETQLLETMFLVETAEAAFQRAQDQLALTRQTWEKEHLDLLEEQAQLESRLRQFKTKREQAAQGIKPETLKLYQTMRPRKNNQPVALMTGNTCGVCGVAQNMAVEREVRQGQAIVNCTNCGRILLSRA